jgi:hypothetical protein
VTATVLTGTTFYFFAFPKNHSGNELAFLNCWWWWLHGFWSQNQKLVLRPSGLTIDLEQNIVYLWAATAFFFQIDIKIYWFKTSFLLLTKNCGIYSSVASADSVLQTLNFPNTILLHPQLVGEEIRNGPYEVVFWALNHITEMWMSTFLFWFPAVSPFFKVIRRQLWRSATLKEDNWKPHSRLLAGSYSCCLRVPQAAPGSFDKYYNDGLQWTTTSLS